MDIDERQSVDATRTEEQQVDLRLLVKLLNDHYAKLQASVSASLTDSLSQTLASKLASTLTAELPQGAPDTRSLASSVEAIFDSVTDALLSVSASGRIRNCNKVCTRYFSLSKQELIGAPLSRILPAAAGIGLAEFLEPFMTNLDNTHVELHSGEVSVRSYEGREFIAEINASKLTTEEDDVFVISLRDVTGRHEAECALRDSEERYRALVENAPEAIVVLDVDKGCFIDANEIACQLFNLPRAQLLSVGPEAISPETQPDGTPSFGVRRGYIDRALSGEHPTFEWLHRDSKGRQIPCEVRFSRLPAGEQRLIRVSITDISERKRNEELAYAQNKILEMIAASTPFDRTMRSICRCTEKIGSGMRAAVMLLDASQSTLGVEEAPSLPDPFRVQLDLSRVADHSTPSGVTVHRGRETVVPNLALDGGSKRLHALAEKYGIRACWSFPLFAEAGQAIGTLDVYLDEARQPSTDELDKLGRMTKLAGIAIKRQQDEERLRRSEGRYRGLFENVVDGVYIASREGELLTVNPALVEMLGYDSVQDLKSVGRTTNLYVNPIDRERVFARLEAQGVVKNFEYRLRRKDGREIVVLENSRAVYDKDGNIVSHEGTITDITDRKIAETRIFEEKERAQVTLQSIGDGVITTDSGGRIDYINPVAQDLCGWDIRSARSKPIEDIMTIVNEHTRTSVENPLTRCLREGRVIALAENSVLIAKQGAEIPIQDSAAPIRDRIGNIVGAVMVFHDVSKETRLFRQLSYQASHDAVTGLINRREFENQLVSALDSMRSNTELTHAVLYIDLDQFKVVNDTFGHTSGDELLLQVSEIIQANIRSTDVLARLGGDEFGVLLERCDESRAMDVAESIRSAIEEFRFSWQGAFTNVRCSIGVVVATSESPSVASVMSSADVACYSAKDMGRNQIHLYQDSDASVRHEEMKWVSRITSAVEENRLELFFQPIVSIGRGTTSAAGHYELLLRMRDENGELVTPDQFIPAAERYNMMSTLDRWVVREALTNLADRPAEGAARYTVAINLSGTSLSEDRFLEFVIKELERQKLPQGAVCFEITETAAISNLSRVVHFMNELKKLGCKFSLDDFGSGLSSFAYLKNLPVDFIKIDGHFIRSVAENAVDESMVRAISQVGQAMGIQTIAERVETKDVMDKLGELGVAFVQGYLIARPVSVASFDPWALAEGRATPMLA